MPASPKALPSSSLAPLMTPRLAGEGGVAGDEADDLDDLGDPVEVADDGLDRRDAR